MIWSLSILVSSLFASSALAGHLNESPIRSRHSQHARAVSRNVTGKGYELRDYYRGQAFLDEWTFFTHPDPTHGNVNFQSREDAIKKKLAVVQEDGLTVLSVDDFSNVPVGGRRDSIRIETKKKYTGGLFIADFVSMPHGCSVWPAYWSVGPNWPAGGEIDVLEGVHEQPTNQYTLHTSEGCEVDRAEVNERTVGSSNLLHNLCVSSGLDNRGCAFSDTDTRSYGHEFNVDRGGVFAHLWDQDGIKMWRFFRDAIPKDIQEKRPNPASWGVPAASFSNSKCDMSKHFFEHVLVLDTTICGDFAGPTYAGSGCPGTCQEAIANADNFKFAKWRINYIAVYNRG